MKPNDPTPVERGGAYAKPVSPARAEGGNSGAALAHLSALENIGAFAHAAGVTQDGELESVANFIRGVATDSSEPALVLCSWCLPKGRRTVVRDGDPDVISHGICAGCQAEVEHGGSRHDGPESSEAFIPENVGGLDA